MTLLNESVYLITDKDVDPTFKDEIMANGSESLAICYQCGTCSGACPSGRRTPYMISRIKRSSNFRRCNLDVYNLL